MKTIRIQTLNCHLKEGGKYPDFGREIIEINDDPITNDFDLWRALDAAENQMNAVILESNKYKYIRESQQKANTAIFANLKQLVMDYVKVKNDLITTAGPDGSGAKTAIFITEKTERRKRE